MLRVLVCDAGIEREIDSVRGGRGVLVSSLEFFDRGQNAVSFRGPLS